MSTSRTASLAGLVAVFTLTFLLMPLVAKAQDRAWVQIEAQPTLTEALERARAYASAFPEVQGYALRSGWYGILLGPYSRAQADARLAELKQERLIPGDSFIAFGREFREAFWPPAGSQAVTPEPAVDAAPADPAPEALAALAPDPAPAKPLPRRAPPRPRSTCPRGRRCRRRCNGSASTTPPSMGPSAPAPAPRWPPGRRRMPPNPPAS